MVQSLAPDYLNKRSANRWGTGEKGGRGRKTYDPGVLQGHHVVNVQVRGGGPGGAVVGGHPLAGRGLAGAVDGDGGGVALEHVLARVAGPRDGDPRREQVTLVVVAARRRLDRQPGQLRLGRRGGGDAGL